MRSRGPAVSVRSTTRSPMSGAASWSRSTTATGTSTNAWSRSWSGTDVPAVLYLATGLVRDEARGERGDDDGLSWSQLGEAVATGLVTVGAHTHAHRTLSRATERIAEDEMRRSKDLIEDRLGVACRHFAYPFAVGSPEADRVARRLFGSAALDAWKTNRRGRLDPHRLGRMPVLASDGQLFFRAKVRGMLEREALAYRALGRGPWKAA